jgi:hypothetical protein
MDKHQTPSNATDSAPSSRSPEELLFERQFGSPALLKAPRSYRLLAIDQGGSGGLLVDIAWPDMAAMGPKIAIHEDAFTWAAIQNAPRDTHATLLDCALFAATRDSAIKRSEAPKTMFQSVFEPYDGQGAPGVFEAVAKFRGGSAAELALGLAKIFPNATLRQVPATLCQSVFPGKLESPHPQMWRALVEAAELGVQAGQANAALKSSSRPRV